MEGAAAEVEAAAVGEAAAVVVEAAVEVETEAVEAAAVVKTAAVVETAVVVEAVAVLGAAGMKEAAVVVETVVVVEAAAVAETVAVEAAAMEAAAGEGAAGVVEAAAGVETAIVVEAVCVVEAASAAGGAEAGTVTPVQEGVTGGAGVGEEVGEAAELATEKVLEQLLRVCEKDMDAADGAAAELSQHFTVHPVEHSLWEQETLEAMNGVLFGCLEPEVGAMQRKKAVYDDERRLSEGSDSCWSDSDSSSEMRGEVDEEPQVQEVAAVVVEAATGARAAVVMEAAAVVETAVGGGAASEMEAPGAETGTTVPEGDAGGAGEVEEEGEEAMMTVGKVEQLLRVCEQDVNAADGAAAELSQHFTVHPVEHSLWEQETLEAMNGVLFGCLEPEVEAMQRKKAVYDNERGLSEGSDSCWSDSDSSSAVEGEVDEEPQVQGEATAAVDAEIVVEAAAEVGAAAVLEAAVVVEAAFVVEAAAGVEAAAVMEAAVVVEAAAAAEAAAVGAAAGVEAAAVLEATAVVEAEAAVEAAAGVEAAAVLEAAAGVEAAAVLEAAGVVEAAAVVAGRQGSLQRSQRKRGLKVESALVPGGLAPKRLRKEVSWRFNTGRRQKKGKGRRRGGGVNGGRRQGRWSMPGFRVDPGGAGLIDGGYIVQAVQTQVTIQGAAGRETWLGVDLLRGGSGVKVTGWMHSGELQRRAAGDAGWLARLRGRGREGWSVEDHSWVCSGGPAVSGHGQRGAVVGWYLPVMVLDEKQMRKVGGTRVVVLMRRVAVGKTAGGVEQAVGIRCRQEWCKHEMGREQMVGTTGQRVQADGGKEIMVEGREVWEEWTGQAVVDTAWRRKVKGQWRTREQAVARWGWSKNSVQDKDKEERDKVYDRG